MRAMKYPKKHPWAHPWKASKRRRKPATKAVAKKTRRVFVTLELETDAPLPYLRDRSTWSVKDMRNDTVRHCIQVQANVARGSK